MPTQVKHGDLGYSVYRNIYCKTLKERDEWHRVDRIIQNAILRIAHNYPDINWVITELMRTAAENAYLYRKRGKAIPQYTYHQDGLAVDLRRRTIIGIPVTAVRDFINEEIPSVKCLIEGDHLHIQSTGGRGVTPPRLVQPDGTINSIELDPLIDFSEEELEDFTLNDEAGIDREVIIPQFLKDPPQSRKPGATQIGDTWLTVPPIDMSIDTVDQHYSMETLRSVGSPKINTGTAIQEISMVLEFPSSTLINFELRPIIAQFKRTPFTTIKNELISKALAPIVGGPIELMELVDGETIRDGIDLAVVKEFAAIPMCLMSIAVSTIPGYPDSVQATLGLQLFNHHPYYPSFGFVPTTQAASQRAWGGVLRNKGRIVTDDTTAVADVRESPLYRRYYCGLLPEYNDFPDEELFGTDEGGEPATSFIPSELNSQLDEYIAEVNNVLMFQYQYTGDTILLRLEGHRHALAKQLDIFNELIHESPLSVVKKGTGPISKQIEDLIKMIIDAVELPGKIASKTFGGFSSLKEKIQIVLGNIGKPIHQRASAQVNFETGLVENMEKRLDEMIKEDPKKVEDIIRKIVEAYTEELDARQGSKPIKELLIIGGTSAGSVNGIDLGGYAQITGISATYNNPITPIPIAQYNVPTMQHMGVGEFGVTINIETDSLELVKQVRVMNSLLTHTAFVTKTTSAELVSYIDTRIEMPHVSQGHLLNTLGINHLVIQNISVSTMKESPNVFNISMSLQQADLLVFQAEQLSGTKTVTSEMINLAFWKISLWIADRIGELDPTVSIEGILPVDQRPPRPTGLWSDLIEEIAQEFIFLTKARNQALGKTKTIISSIAGVFVPTQATTGGLPLGHHLRMIAIKFIGAIATVQATLMEFISTHNTRSQIIRLIENDTSRLTIGDSDLDDLWKQQLNKQMRGGASSGRVKSVHTAYPDLDLPAINGTNLYTSPAFYLYGKHGMDGHIFSRVKQSLNFMTNRVRQATMANNAMAAELRDELRAIIPLDTSFTFEHRGKEITLNVPKEGIYGSLDDYISDLESLHVREAGLQKLHPGTEPLFRSNKEHMDFVKSARDLGILNLIAVQGIAMSLVETSGFKETSAPDARDVTRDLINRYAPSDKNTMLNVINKVSSSSGANEQFRTFAKQVFEQGGGAFNNELTQRQAKETVQNLLDEYIRMDQVMNTEAYQISKYWGMETYNTLLRKAEIMRRTQEVHKNDPTGVYDRAFPTFKLYFIEEDAPNWQLFDDFYSYSAVHEISIIKSKRAASDVAIIKLANISGVLTNPNSVRDAEVTGSNTVEEQDVRSLFLRPGISVAIRMGYGTDPMQLPLVFMGSVTEVPAGEDIEIVCQGWGAELYNPVGTGSGIDIGWSSFDKALGDVATRILNESGDGLDHFGRWSLFNERDDIRLTGQRRWAEAILSTVGLDWLAAAVSKTNNLSENIYLHYSDSLLPWTNNTFDWKIFNQTAWDALQEVCLYVPNYVVRPMFFNDQSSVNTTEQRMTLYLGPKDGFYKFTDDPLITNINGDTADTYEKKFILKKEFSKEELLNFISSDLRGMPQDVTFKEQWSDEGLFNTLVSEITKFGARSLTWATEELFREGGYRDPFYFSLEQAGYIHLLEWIDKPIDPSISPVTPRLLIDKPYKGGDLSQTGGDIRLVTEKVETLISILDGTYDVNLSKREPTLINSGPSDEWIESLFNDKPKDVGDSLGGRGVHFFWGNVDNRAWTTRPDDDIGGRVVSVGDIDSETWNEWSQSKRDNYWTWHGINPLSMVGELHFEANRLAVDISGDPIYDYNLIRIGETNIVDWYAKPQNFRDRYWYRHSLDFSDKPLGKLVNGKLTILIDKAFNTAKHALANDAVAVMKRGATTEDPIGHENLKRHGQEFNRKFFVNHPHYRPFQAHWMVDSYRHIVYNKITADAEGIGNEVVLSFPSSDPVMMDPRIGATSINAMNEAVRSYRVVIDDDIKAEYRRVIQTFQKNIDTNWYDELNSFFSVKQAMGPSVLDFVRNSDGKLWIPSYMRIANTILANHLQPMYTGELCILGNAAMKPWDVVYIQDDYNDMQGPIEIDTVIHKMSRREGFTTKIVPSTVVYQQNYAALIDPDFIQWEWYKGFAEMGWGALEGWLYGLPLRSVAKVIGSSGPAGTIPRALKRRTKSSKSVYQDTTFSKDVVRKARATGYAGAESRFLSANPLRATGRGLLFLGRLSPLIGVAIGLDQGIYDGLSTWTNSVGRLFGGNVVHYLGLTLNGQHLQAGLDGMRLNSIRDHRMATFKHGLQEIIYHTGGVAGSEPGEVTNR